MRYVITDSSSGISCTKLQHSKLSNVQVPGVGVFSMPNGYAMSTLEMKKVYL